MFTSLVLLFGLHLNLHIGLESSLALTVFFCFPSEDSDLPSEEEYSQTVIPALVYNRFLAPLPPQEADFCPKLETQYRPCMCYIFEKPWVQGPQRQCSRVSDMPIQIHKYKYKYSFGQS